MSASASNEARKIRDVTSNVRSVGRGCVFFRFAAAEMEFASKGEQADPPARANNHRRQRTSNSRRQRKNLRLAACLRAGKSIPFDGTRSKVHGNSPEQHHP